MMNSKDVILNSRPTTFIDIDSKEVKQTGELHMHFAMKLEFLKLDLQQLLEGLVTPVFPTKYVDLSALLSEITTTCDSYTRNI